MRMYYEAPPHLSDESFGSELLPGEHILWTGHPVVRIVLHREDLFAIPFSLLWGGGAIFWEATVLGIIDIGSAPVRHRAHLFMVLWGIPFVLMGQYIIWGRFFYDAWRKKHTAYALTDQRIMTLTTGWGGKFYSAYLISVPAIQRNIRHDGIGTLIFGYSFTPYNLFGPSGRQRSGTSRVPVFQDVENAAQVYDIAARARDACQKNSS